MLVLLIYYYSWLRINTEADQSHGLSIQLALTKKLALTKMLALAKKLANANKNYYQETKRNDLNLAIANIAF